jgi:NADPH:quinone reductase-like Zn-dependent oxidoreductase
MVGGMSAIGRIVAPGPDAVVLEPGKLVFVDCVIRGRDEPGALFISAIHEGGHPGSKKLIRDSWRDGNFAEYARVPLENCIPLNEIKLCQTLGYSYHQLMYLSYLLVPFGGLRDIKAEPGDTVAIFPATGGFGGAGVQVAISMGCKVIAMGRNEQELARLKIWVTERNSNAIIETVKIFGDEATDTAALLPFGPIDKILDLTPPVGAKSTHLKSLMSVLKYEGCISLSEYPFGVPTVGR